MRHARRMPRNSFPGFRTTTVGSDSTRATNDAGSGVTVLVYCAAVVPTNGFQPCVPVPLPAINSSERKPLLQTFVLRVTGWGRPATEDERRRESMMFAILLSVMERSYLMYRDQTDAFKKEQWSGWETYIKSWVGRGNFAAEWERTKREFDPAFVVYLDGVIGRR